LSIVELRESLPAPHQKHLEPGAPLPARMMAARGILPLAPREMTIVLCGLTLDETPEVSAAARAALEKVPDKLLLTALEAGVPPAALSILAAVAGTREEVAERLVLSRMTPDAAVALVAAVASEKVAEIIAGDQERCLRSVEVVRALREAPHLLRSSRDRVFDFLARQGIFYGDMPEMAEAVSRLSSAELVEAAEKVELPPEVQSLIEDSPDAERRAEIATEALEKAPDEAVDRVPMLKLVTGLGVSQRVALAVKGNKEARSILVRDQNRVVAAAAIRNPRITEQEVVAAAQSRSVSDEVIRIVSNSKELTRPYGVKVALVNNPKTPLPTAMRMLTLLRDADVRAVAKSKNVPTAVSNQARRLVASKTS
jgi:hypothetical protein